MVIGFHPSSTPIQLSLTQLFISSFFFSLSYCSHIFLIIQSKPLKPTKSKEQRQTKWERSLLCSAARWACVGLRVMAGAQPSDASAFHFSEFHQFPSIPALLSSFKSMLQRQKKTSEPINSSFSFSLLVSSLMSEIVDGLDCQLAPKPITNKQVKPTNPIQHKRY